jgi:hypothetical protein
MRETLNIVFVGIFLKMFLKYRSKDHLTINEKQKNNNGKKSPQFKLKKS